LIVNHHVIVGLCAGYGIENADSGTDSRQATIPGKSSGPTWLSNRWRPGRERRKATLRPSRHTGSSELTGRKDMQLLWRDLPGARGSNSKNREWGQFAVPKGSFVSDAIA
jgi:hypothetical protein